jgi:phage-related protein (TIGR01555 family)
MIYKMKGLHDGFAAGTDSDIMQRLAMLDRVRSVMGTMVVDADEEEVTALTTTSFAGVGDILDRIKGRLLAVTDIPHTILFNESPSGGLSGKGESEVRQWYDHVKSEQEGYLKQKLDKILEVMFKSKLGPTKGKVLDKKTWGYTFKSLWQQDDLQKSQVYYATAQADEIYQGLGVLDSPSIQKLRFPEQLDLLESVGPSAPAGVVNPEEQKTNKSQDHTT